MQAVILAGGKGTRLASRLNGLPKPLVTVGGVPLLQRQLVALSAQGVTEALVLVNHEAAQIGSFLAGRDFGCRTVVVDDGQPRGTAGAVLACLDHLQDSFLVVYGDTLFDIDIASIVAAHRSRGPAATLLVHPNDHPADSDLVEVDDAGLIQAFHRYPHPPGSYRPNLVNAAFYVMERSLLETYRSMLVPADFAGDLFPRALQDGQCLYGYRSYEYIKDLGTPARLDKVERHLATGVVARARRDTPQRAVFVDRDGTLNTLNGYIRRAEELTILPGVVSGLKRLNEAERRVVVITNQPVLARGECSFDDMRRIHAKLETELGREGVYIDALYVCPHHPDGGFEGEVATLKIACDCRKPSPGLIIRATAEMNIDLAQSFFIGDSARDMQAARAANVASVLVRTGESCAGDQTHADFEVSDFAQAVDLILVRLPKAVGDVSLITSGIAEGDLILVSALTNSEMSALGAILAISLRQRGLRPRVVPLRDAERLTNLDTEVTIINEGHAALLDVSQFGRRIHRVFVEPSEHICGGQAGDTTERASLPAALSAHRPLLADDRTPAQSDDYWIRLDSLFQTGSISGE